MVDQAQAEAGRRHHLVTLSGLPPIAFDLLNVLVIDDVGIEWLHDLRARTIVSVSWRDEMPRSGSSEILFLKGDVRSRFISHRYFDVIILAVRIQSVDILREYLDACVSVASPGCTVVLDIAFQSNVDGSEIEQLLASFNLSPDINVNGSLLTGRAVAPGTRPNESEHVRLLYKMDIKPRWGFDSPNPVLQKVLSRHNQSFLGALDRYASFAGSYSNISAAKINEVDPFWDNHWFPMLDGIALYAETAIRRPDIFFEIGSGNSTKFVARAIRDHHLQTKIISVDPEPRAEISQICDFTHRCRFEEFDLSKLLELRDQNVFLFMDGSHYSFPNSDVNLFFLELLPQLPGHWLLGIHDVIWPYDYLNLDMRFFNEQYVLAPYLIADAIEPQFAAVQATFDANLKMRTKELLDPISRTATSWAGGAVFLFQSRMAGF